MTSSSYTKIGIFLVAACAIAVAACLVFGAGSFRDRALVCETYVEGSVQGVSVGSPVKYRGIPIGSVREISFAWAAYADELPDTREGLRAARWARIVFAIEDPAMVAEDPEGERLAGQIAHGLRAHLKTQGITGVVYVDLDFVAAPNDLPPPPWKPRHLLVPAAPSFLETMTGAMRDVAREVGKLGDVADEVRDLVDTARLSLEEGRLPLLDAIDNAGRATRLLVETLERVRDEPSLLLRRSAPETVPEK